MSWTSTQIPIPEREAIERLACQPGAFRLCDEGRVFLGARPTAESSLLDPFVASVQPLPEAARDWPWWVGVLPYEAFRNLERGSRAPGYDTRDEPHVSSVIWRRYDAVAQVDSEGIFIQGSSPAAVQGLVQMLNGRAPGPAAIPRLDWAAPPESGDLHIERVAVALERIARGDLYQVNLARRFRFRAEGTPLHLLSSLGPMARAPFAAALDLGDVQVISTSPELFLDYQPNGKVVTRPIKGTRPRSADPAEDARLSAELEASEKERAELAMVIDIERNDLGRLAEPGSVRMSTPPHVVSHPTVHHREASVEAQLAPGHSRERLLLATMPSGSVTGAPKLAAMELIADLETERRGLYTGALGYVTHGGALRLSMAIRILTIRDGEAHYYAGGGIVADSDPAQELEETIWKAEQLRALVSV